MTSEADETSGENDSPLMFYMPKKKEKGSVLYRLLNGVAKRLLLVMQREGVSTDEALASSSVGLLEAVSSAVVGFNAASLDAISAWSIALSKIIKLKQHIP